MPKFFALFAQNNQPPDIDEMLRQLKRRFAAGMRGEGDSPRSRRAAKNGGGKNGGGGEEDGGWPLPSAGSLTILAGFVLVLGYALYGFFTVDANERVVMFRLGVPTDVRGPGLKWHFPLVEDYVKVNVSEVRRVEVGYRDDTKNKNPRESLMLTGNLNIIDMQFVVQYALNDPELFLFENRFAAGGRGEDAINAADVVQQVAETAMREVVGRNNIDFVLYEGREAVAEETKTLMQTVLDRYKTGISVQQVAVQNVQPPDQVQDAFEDAIKARQDRERKINEGEAYANKILPRAEGQASRIVKNAEGYKESMIVRASGETQRFSLLAREYRLAPEVTRRRLYLETVERVMGRARKIVIDDSVGGGNVLLLPLDQLAGALMQQRGAASDSADAGTSAPTTLTDFKEALRQRARDGLDALEAR